MQAKQKVPDGWRLELLDNLAKRGSGHTPDKTKSDYWNGGIKWISLADSSQLDNGYIHTTDKEISTVGLKNSSAVLHPAETVVISRDAGVGKSAVMAAPMAVSQHFMAWQCDNQHTLNSWFLYYWLQMMKPEFERQAVGSTIKTIGLPYFKKLRVLAPSYTEQTKIAQILSTWDKAIATTERLLANSQQQKQALMQQLLTGQKRFKQFADTWKTYQLGDLFERVTKKNTENNTNVVSISAQQGLIRQDEFFKKSVASETLEGYYLLSHGQFAYNKSYSNGYPMGAIKRLNRYEKGVVTTLYICFAVRDESNFCPVFFEQFFDAGLLNEGLAQVAHEGGRAHGLLNVKPSDFFSLKVKIPPFEEQQKIAQVLSTADAEISNLQAQLAKLKLEKKALMQQLLTGQRRVKLDADAAA